VVAKWTHIPVAKLLESEREKLLNMEGRLRQRVVGQDRALEAVAEAIRRNRAGLSDPRRPIGSFLFLGPTGVGKTELCKAEEGGRLTEAVRRRPYSVVLFDEIEKAHRDVFNVLLQVLDDGRLTDGQGRTVDFKNTIIVMTSNIASQVIQAMAEKKAEQWEIESQLQEALKQHFRPEFLNRIDETVVFRSLTKEDLDAIIEIQMRELAGRLAERQITLEITPPAKELVAELGFDPAYGARPMKRLIQRKIDSGLADRILAGEIQDGDHVIVDAGNKRFLFTVRRPEVAAAAGGQPPQQDQGGNVVEGQIVEE